MKNLALSSLLIIGVGCGTLLPTQTITTQTQWRSYEDVHAVVSSIRTGDSLDHLKTLGIDVASTANIESLTYLDIASRFGLIGYRDKIVIVPEGVKKLMAAAEKGRVNGWIEELDTSLDQAKRLELARKIETYLVEERVTSVQLGTMNVAWPNRREIGLQILVKS